MIRVLIVDDSATMRKLIAAALSDEMEFKIVSEAADPLQAREAIKILSPDVITLDVEMPNMNGLEFLERLMRLHPMPVVMVSTLTTRGAEVHPPAPGSHGWRRWNGAPSTACPSRQPPPPTPLPACRRRSNWRPAPGSVQHL